MVRGQRKPDVETSVDPCTLLRGLYTRDNVLDVCDAFDVEAQLGLCYYFGIARNDPSVLRHDPRYGITMSRQTSYYDIPEILIALGGKTVQADYFWSIATKDAEHHPIIDAEGQRARQMMLAFMLTWLEE